MTHKANKKARRRTGDSVTQTTHSTWFLSFISDSLRDRLLPVINPSGIKGNKILGTPCKAPGIIMGEKVSRESKRTATFKSALHYSWHNLFSIFIKGLLEKANQSDGYLIFSFPSGLLFSEYDCSKLVQKVDLTQKAPLR